MSKKRHKQNLPAAAPARAITPTPALESLFADLAALSPHDQHRARSFLDMHLMAANPGKSLDWLAGYRAGCEDESEYQNRMHSQFKEYVTHAENVANHHIGRIVGAFSVAQGLDERLRPALTIMAADLMHALSIINFGYRTARNAGMTLAYDQPPAWVYDLYKACETYCGGDDNGAQLEAVIRRVGQEQVDAMLALGDIPIPRGGRPKENALDVICEGVMRVYIDQRCTQAQAVELYHDDLLARSDDLSGIELEALAMLDNYEDARDSVWKGIKRRKLHLGS